MLKKFLSIAGVIFAFIAWAISGQIGRELGNAAFSTSKPSQKEIEATLNEALRLAARQVNQSTPIMVDENTRMDTATIGPGLRMTYHYTLPRYSSRDIEPAWLYQNLRPVVKTSVCNNKKMQLSLKHGVTYVYSYAGNDGTKISSFEIKGIDCGYQATKSDYDHDRNSSLTSYSVPSQLNSAAPNTNFHSPPVLSKPQSETQVETTHLVDKNLNDDYGIIIEVQKLLKQLGFDPGPVDGIFGFRTRQAITMAENKLGLYQRGYITQKLRVRLADEVSKLKRNNSQSYYGRPQKNAACQFKAVMTDQDYINCGANPPSSYEYVSD